MNTRFLIVLLFLTVILKIITLPLALLVRVLRLFGLGPKHRFSATLYRRRGDRMEFVHVVEIQRPSS